MPYCFQLGFIGAGHMATAIAGGLIRAGAIAPVRCLASDIDPRCRDAFGAATGIVTIDDNARIATECETAVFAIKPQQCDAALGALRGIKPRAARFVSIMAGVRSGRIEAALGGTPRVVRAMPNLFLQIGCGMTALCRGRWAGVTDMDAALALFRPAGEAIEVGESQIDAVTAISGSGPAYFAALAQATIEAGIALGLPPNAARLLTGQTLLGAARVTLETDDDLAELARRVQSPGGSTEAAFKVLDAEGVTAALKKAIHAAQRRNEEMGRGE